MKKTLIIVNLIFLLLVLGGCTEEKPTKQLKLLEYPPQVTQTENFTVKCEYLTEDPGDESVKVVMTIREADTNEGLLTKEKALTNRSQVISFSELDLSGVDAADISQSLYFELKLIISGKFKQKLTTESNLTLVANQHANIITTYFKPFYDEDGNEKTAAFGNYLSEENPYYFALPYSPGYKDHVYKDNPDLYGYDSVKNRWIEISYFGSDAQENYVYAQWEDVGPWNVYDPYYVFGTNDERPYAENGIDMGWTGTVRETNKAGLDISPEAMKYLVGEDSNGNPKRGKIEINWRFVSADEVPDGPWLNEVSTDSVNFNKINLNTTTLRTLEE